MKKAYIGALLVMGLSISAFATDSVPVDTKGNFTFPSYAGSSTCQINTSTGTNPVLCTSGAGVILQIIGAGLVSSTETIVFRDSATANVTSSTLTVVDGKSIAGVYIYPRFVNGLSANSLSAPSSTALEHWTIIYTKSLK